MSSEFGPSERTERFISVVAAPWSALLLGNGVSRTSLRTLSRAPGVTGEQLCAENCQSTSTSPPVVRTRQAYERRA